MWDSDEAAIVALKRLRACSNRCEYAGSRAGQRLPRGLGTSAGRRRSGEGELGKQSARVQGRGSRRAGGLRGYEKENTLGREGESEENGSNAAFHTEYSQGSSFKCQLEASGSRTGLKVPAESVAGPPPGDSGRWRWAAGL